METNFAALNGTHCDIMLWHHLWGSQRFEVDQLSIINDDKRVGIKIMGQDIYINKLDARCTGCENGFILESDTQKIEVLRKCV